VFSIEKYQSLLPLLYLVVIAIITAAFHILNVPKEVSMLIIGAGLTRVKIGGNIK